jgi:hypothetical protein
MLIMEFSYGFERKIGGVRSDWGCLLLQIGDKGRQNSCRARLDVLQSHFRWIAQKLGGRASLPIESGLGVGRAVTAPRDAAQNESGARLSGWRREMTERRKSGLESAAVEVATERVGARIPSTGRNHRIMNGYATDDAGFDIVDDGKSLGELGMAMQEDSLEADRGSRKCGFDGQRLPTK